MAGIPRGASQVLDLSDTATITLFESPDPNALYGLVFSAGDAACELHMSADLDEGALPVPDTSTEPAYSGPYLLNGGPRFVDAGAGSATTVTVQVLQIVGE